MIIIEPKEYPSEKHSLVVGDEIIDVLTRISGNITLIDMGVLCVKFLDGKHCMYNHNLILSLYGDIVESHSTKLHPRVFKQWYVCNKIKIKPK